MALSGKISDRKLPEGLLEISERVFVFNCCLTSNISSIREYRAYIRHTVEQLREHFPEFSLMVQNFGDENHKTRISNPLFKCGMTVINYHCQSKNCLSLPPETIQHFLSTSRKWISSGKKNFLLMHCENGCLPLLAFVLAAFLIYNKQCTDECKALDMIYKQVPSEILQSLPVNPLPSQLRYLGYVLRRDPFAAAADRTCKMLFSVTKESKAVRLFRQADFDLFKVYANCPVQGDDVLECVNDKSEHEEVLCRVVFKTEFVRANTVTLGLEETDAPLDVKDRFPNDFRAEILSSETDSSSSLGELNSPGKDKEDWPTEACVKIQDTSTNFHSGASEADYDLKTTQRMTVSRITEENLENTSSPSGRDEKLENVFLQNEAKSSMHSPETAQKHEMCSASSNLVNKDDQLLEVSPKNGASENNTTSAQAKLMVTQSTLLNSSDDSDSTSKKTDSSEPHVFVCRPAQSKIILPRISQISPNSNSLQVSLSQAPLSRYRGAATSALGITALLHDHAEFSNRQVQCPSTSASALCLKNHVDPTDSSKPHPLEEKPKSLPPPPPLPPLLPRSNGPRPLTASKNSTVPPAAPSPPPPPQHAALPPARIRQVVPPPPAPLPKGRPTYLQCVKGKLQPRASMRTQTQAQPRKAPLRAYHWLKLTRAMQGSLWAEAQRPEEASKVLELDICEIESLFSTTVTNSDHGDAGRKMNRHGSSGLKPNKVHLIELRRAYNCEIMLTKVKVPLSDLMNSVLALDGSALDIDQVDNLIKFCPTKEEIELLKNYNGEKENLGKCEQFFLELMKVPRVESKLRVFSFKIQFFSQLSDLRNSLNIVNSASQEVRNSVKLKRIMQSILSLGNALNHGTARGSAVGFRLDSLLKLSETRSHNNKLTLLHYLCKVLSEKLPEVLDFHEDLASLEAATKIQLKYLAEEMQALSKGLEKVSHELNASDKDGAVSEYFCKTLKEFYGCAEAEVRALASIYSVAGRNADALALYFGEDPVRCPFEQVVSTLLNFVRVFRRAHEENRKQMELEKKKEQKEAKNEKSKVNGSWKELEMRL
ncbi:Formin-like protein 18 [Striga hermonthica]|uniref:Formin-like protein n=1 Tax=Striga hermonthica TaxID=68872 RepID=A0A9N7MP11_STRHE|nr:Formin-like protein 18 [Striga hermonthica]